MKKTIRGIFIIMAMLALLTVSAQAADMNLSVAASLREAVTELSENFSRKNPTTKFIHNFGASGALAKQIENGAPADLFFSANQKWMDYLKAKNLLDEKHISIFAFNSLVFVGRPDLKVKTIQDVTTLEKVAIGSPKSVPAGEYAMAALTKGRS